MTTAELAALPGVTRVYFIGQPEDCPPGAEWTAHQSTAGFYTDPTAPSTLYSNIIQVTIADRSVWASLPARVSDCPNPLSVRTADGCQLAYFTDRRGSPGFTASDLARRGDQA